MNHPTADPTRLEKVLAQVQTLLAIANDPYAKGNEGEREAARERAERLMIRHSITTASLTERSNPASPLDRQVARETYIGIGSWLLIKFELFAHIHKVFGCEALRGPTQRGWHEITVFGYDTDMKLAGTLYRHLEPQMLAGMAKVPGSRGGSARRSYALGYIAKISERLHEYYVEELQEVQDATTGKTLVLASRDRAVVAAVAEAYPNAKTPQFTIRPEWAAIGLADGSRANLTPNHTLDEATRPQLDASRPHQRSHETTSQ